MVSDLVPMEGVSESCQEVKAKAGKEEVKKEQEVFGQNRCSFFNVGPENMGSCKKRPDFLAENGVPIWTNNNNTRHMAIATSGPNVIIPTPDQLTIFYGGSVVVFDAIPAEKAHEIMIIAAAAAAAVKPVDMKTTGSGLPASSPVLTRCPSMQSTASPQAQRCPIRQNSFCKMKAELPIARRHSLQRFFEKRRDRLVSKSPYPRSPAVEMAEAKCDLGAEALPNAGYYEKPLAPEGEFQPKVAANLA